METNKRSGPKRIIIDVPEEFHARIKSTAATKDMSIKNWVIRALLKTLREEKNNEQEINLKESK